jgi:hypothetical protein
VGYIELGDKNHFIWHVLVEMSGAGRVAQVVEQAWCPEFKP